MPDPLTAASAFATLVGLIVNFRQEKGASESLNHQQFMEWLEHHHHEEIKNLICNTAALRGEVDNLLRADHAVIIQKLDAVSDTLASLMSQVTVFRGLTMAMMPQSELSNQAVEILRQFVNSDSSYFLWLHVSTSCDLRLENGGHIDCAESRFVRDDLDKLVSLDLLKPEYCSDSSTMFHITRNAHTYIRAIGKGSS